MGSILSNIVRNILSFKHEGLNVAGIYVLVTPETWMEIAHDNDFLRYVDMHQNTDDRDKRSIIGCPVIITDYAKNSYEVVTNGQ